MTGAMRVNIILYLTVILAFYRSEAAVTVYSWGINDWGQLGLEDPQNPTRIPSRVNAYEGKNIVDVQVSGAFHFATTGTGEVYTSGNNYFGCLGLGNAAPSSVSLPTQNTDLTGCSVQVGKRHVNALCSGNLTGWGNWAGYVLNVGTGSYKKVQRALASYGLDGRVDSMTHSSEGLFLRLKDGGVQVAGAGSSGELGIGSYTFAQKNFVNMTFWGSEPLRKIFTSHSQHVCALTTNYSVLCWGANSGGQLGLGHTDARATPTRVPFFEDNGIIVSQIAFGESHTLALGCDGKVYTWGLAQFGALGNGVVDNATFPTPFELTGLRGKGVVEIVAGANYNYARTDKNVWYTWGAGYGGVLGTKSDVNVLVPKIASDLTALGITRVSLSSAGRSVFGWTAANPFTTTQNCPVLVDECETGQHTCSANSICTDTNRKYTCACKPGYVGDGYLITAGGTGCADVDECTANPCSASPVATCANSIGGYTCTCPSGYHGNGIKASITGGEGCIADVNECQVNPNACAPNAVCTDTVWSYTCACKPGYNGNGFPPGAPTNGTGCVDINECALSTTNDCDPTHGVCTNLNGTYGCHCAKGYTGSGFVCTDINECASAETNDCSADGVCTNLNGTYSCACKPGYSGNGKTCTEINECNIPTSCHADSVCVNLPGSFNCTCKPGYLGDGKVTCVDLNECSAGTNNCHANATCTNLPGSFNCTCRAGFTGNGVNCAVIPVTTGSTTASATTASGVGSTTSASGNTTSTPGATTSGAASTAAQSTSSGDSTQSGQSTSSSSTAQSTTGTDPATTAAQSTSSGGSGSSTSSAAGATTSGSTTRAATTSATVSGTTSSTFTLDGGYIPPVSIGDGGSTTGTTGGIGDKQTEVKKKEDNTKEVALIAVFCSVVGVIIIALVVAIAMMYKQRQTRTYV